MSLSEPKERNDYSITGVMIPGQQEEDYLLGDPTFEVTDALGNKGAPLKVSVVADSSLASSVNITGSGASATTAATDYSYTFARQANHLLLQNNTASVINFNFDAPASPGSFVLGVSQTIQLDVPCLVLHLYTAATQNVQGSASGNLVIKGWS